MTESVRSTPPLAQGRPWFFEVLPCHPPPCAGECWSGYLLRLAEVNGMQLRDLAHDLFPQYRGPHAGLSRLSWEYPVDEWGRVPLRTQLSPAHLKKLTVVPWIEKFRPLPILAPSGTVGPGHSLHHVVHSHLQVCPLCLQAQPYLRLLWRLVPVRVCLQHRTWLQTECHQCGRPLAVLRSSSRHLRCAGCGADLRSLPVVIASPDILAAQARRQADLQFLLNPAVSLVKLPDSESPMLAADLAKAIGLKFRYLRQQAGYSLEEISQRTGMHSMRIADYERGTPPSLPFALIHLETLGCSWPDFAAAEVPRTFVEHLQQTLYLPLRLCPTPNCPNHQPPPSTRVTLLADLPDRRVARFRCAACGHNYTRGYDGRLMTKPRRPVIRPGEPPTVPKSSEEIARLTEMGLQGKDNREIAHRLGWGEKTVRMYWISLGLEEQVHQAQAQRRDQEKRQRHADIRDQVLAILDTLLQQDEEVTLRHIGRALGNNPDYLQSQPDLGAYVQSIAREHNSKVRQRRHEGQLAQITQVAENLKHSDRSVTVKGFAQLAGLSLDHLWNRDPELYAVVRQAAREHRERIRTARLAAQCERINAAAARLVRRGTRLTYGAICREAGLKEYRAYREQTILDLIRHWIGDFAPGD